MLATNLVNKWKQVVIDYNSRQEMDIVENLLVEEQLVGVENELPGIQVIWIYRLYWAGCLIKYALLE